jgi:hypothetical protein
MKIAKLKLGRRSFLNCPEATGVFMEFVIIMG